MAPAVTCAKCKHLLSDHVELESGSRACLSMATRGRIETPSTLGSNPGSWRDVLFLQCPCDG